MLKKQALGRIAEFSRNYIINLISEHNIGKFVVRFNFIHKSSRFFCSKFSTSIDYPGDLCEACGCEYKHNKDNFNERT